MWSTFMSKTVLVTGASAGIGEATVRRFLADGYIVYAAARRLDRMAPLAAAGAKLLPLDLTDDASIVAAVDKIRSDTGRLDVLINNAGYGSYGAVEDVPMDEARRQFEVNVFGAARLCQLALPMMRAQKSGKIVNVTSIGGKFGDAVWRLVSRNQVRARGPERQPSLGDETVRHRCDRHRARRDPHRMERHCAGKSPRPLR